MHDYLLSSEWIRFAFVLGVAVSMVLYEKRHLTTGSIVVPGYIAVFIIHPLVIAATFLNALATYWLVNQVLCKHFLLYGRTKFTVLAVVSTVIQTIMLRVTPSGQWLWEMDIPLFIGVGYIVPALIAHDMARQGIARTTKSVLLAGAIVAAPIALALALDLPGVNDLAPVAGFGNTAFSLRWLPFAVVLSVLASWAVAFNYNLRSGGFVGAAFTGMFMADPWQVVAAVCIGLVTYVIVAKFLMRHMILFGRRKFSSMLLVSSTISWSSLWLGARFLDATWEQHLGVGSLALTPLLLPGLMANDSQRTSPARVLLGLTMAGSFVVTTTWWAESVVSGKAMHPAWKVMAVASCVLLFAKQARAGLSRLADRIELPSIDVPPIGERLTAALRRPAAAYPATASAVTAASGAASVGTQWITPWEVWSLRHPTAAQDAEAWLDDQLARFTRATRQSSPTGIDFATSSVLQTALESDRGTRRIPRTPVPPVYRDQRTALPLAEISEASDSTREAQLSGSDVSDNTARQADDGNDLDATTPLTRPFTDF